MMENLREPRPVQHQPTTSTLLISEDEAKQLANTPIYKHPLRETDHMDQLEIDKIRGLYGHHFSSNKPEQFDFFCRLPLSEDQRAVFIEKMLKYKQIGVDAQRKQQQQEEQL